MHTWVQYSAAGPGDCIPCRALLCSWVKKTFSMVSRVDLPKVRSVEVRSDEMSGEEAVEEEESREESS